MVRTGLLTGALGLALAFAGCAGRPSQGVLVPTAQTAEGTSQLQVLAATTRARSTKDLGEMFSGERAALMSYAAVTVSIPPDSTRKIGNVQWPSVVPGDPRRDFVTVSADYLDKSSFSAAVTAASRRTGRRKVLVFVHGFNNKFDDAVYRFSQIVHDSKAPVIPVLFTWPSRGETRLRAYTYDRESANYSRDALEALLDELARHRSVDEITILAHSMGNWVTLEALRTRSIRAGHTTGKVKNVMLVAPDVDVDVFRTQMQRMKYPRPRISLFLSADDKALSLSQFIWGGEQRLGKVDPNAEPYRSEFAQQRIEVFDLTSLKENVDHAHDRAFEDVTSVVAMIKKRFADGQQIKHADLRLED